LMKVLPSAFFGLLSWSVYRYGEKTVDGRFGLVMSLLFALNLSSLRLSWDLHKQVLAFAFLMMALLLLKEELNLKRGVTFSIFITLSILTHQITVIPLGFIILYQSIRSNNWKLLALLVLAALTTSPFVFRYLYPLILPIFSLPSITKSLLFVVYAMPVLVILGLFDLYTGQDTRDRGVMTCFLAASFIFSLITRGEGFEYDGWRFAALMAIPLSFYAAQGALKIQSAFPLKRPWAVAAIVIVSGAYVAPMLTGNNSVLIFKFMPMNFSDNIFPWRAQHELEALIESAKWCVENTPRDAIILTEDSMGDWVKIYAERQIHLWWDIEYKDVLDWARDRNECVYVIWWNIDAPNLKIVAENLTPGSKLKVMELIKPA